MGKIEICDGITLRLDNVLINRIMRFSMIDENDYVEEISMETELAKMENVFKMNDIKQIGPLIQSSTMNRYSEEKINIEINLMLQANEYFDAPRPYQMKENITVPGNS